MAKKKYAEIKDVAKLVEDVNEEVLNTQTMVRDVANNLSKKIHDSEDRLLTAIRGIESRKEDVETLQDDVRDLDTRVSSLERKRDAHR